MPGSARNVSRRKGKSWGEGEEGGLKRGEEAQANATNQQNVLLMTVRRVIRTVKVRHRGASITYDAIEVTFDGWRTGRLDSTRYHPHTLSTDNHDLLRDGNHQPAKNPIIRWSEQSSEEEEVVVVVAILAAWSCGC